MTGLRLIPQAVGAAAGSLGLGILMRVTGRYLYFIYASTFLLVLASSLISTYTLTTPSWHQFLYFFIFGLGYSGMLTVTLVALISAVDHKHQAVVASASIAFRSSGSSIGITAASSVFQNLLKSGLWSRFGDREDAIEIIQKIRNSLDYTNKVPADWASWGALFVSKLSLEILGLVSSLFMKEHKLPMNLARK
ncbi:hypothetical protein PAAG_11241 [Paracoccidioides lutzii Pb01]|uniref:Major facilitator superfamily (MFS) profile domain-containing protein n=1 Tax=Paracoccidioides lutzii (strain ATCC MYA-826 / Pb01) TaxID=502779 RepID=A0A0A2V7J1_PARBA|nr:hypothetical protein PAAG_11241 [Paracoccidioides lutzii Pb01]KGQ02060.1 hypothetical protein PAAG_11241 [Paracoccidioides lutzii Pb01]